MKRLLVDGLRVASDVVVARVPTARGGAADWTLRVGRGEVAHADVAGVRWTGHVRDADRRWCRYGREGATARILLDPWFDLRLQTARRRADLRHPGPRRTDTRVLRRALPYLAAATGRLALHAAAAVFPAGAVLFCADSRTGKSTLALGLDALGIPVLGDDHVVVERGDDGALWARPSVPWIEVGAASRRAFRLGVRRAAAGDDRVRLTTARPADGARVAGLAFLRRGARPRRTRIPPRTALPRLLRGFAFVADPADGQEQARRFDLASALVTEVPVATFAVPQGLARLRESLPDLAAAWGWPGSLPRSRPVRGRGRSARGG